MSTTEVSSTDASSSDVTGSHYVETSAAPPAPAVLDTALVDSLSWQPLARLGAAQVKTVLRTSDSVAGLLRLEAGTSENAHIHADASHHGWVLRGEATVAGTRVSAGSYFHIPAGARHAVTDVGADGFEVFFVYQFPASR